MVAERRGVWAIAVSVSFGLMLASVAQAQNWPRFRGPNGQGLSSATSIPTQWSERDYNWKVSLPGKGHSTPVIWAGKVYVTSADERAGHGFLLCLNAADGTERWRRQWDLHKYPMNSLNSLASPTPAVDGEGPYVLWPAGDETVLAALTHEGRDRWTVQLGGVHARHGRGSSPIVVDGYVIVSNEQEANDDGVKSQWLAVDRQTGRIVWRRTEEPVVNASYSTPCLYQDPTGRKQLVFASNAHGITGVDLDTGDTVWEAGSVLPERVVSSPVVAGPMVFATCGKGGRGYALAAVRPKQVGQEYQVDIAYTIDDGKIVPYVPTPVVYNGLLFTFHDSGQVSCLRCDTGQVLWSEKPAGRFYGSPICVDGALYAITRKGGVVVLKADAAYTLLGVNPLGQGSQATPAVADGRMYLRTESQLISIGGKEP